jgi:hypothetical protein
VVNIRPTPGLLVDAQATCVGTLRTGQKTRRIGMSS